MTVAPEVLLTWYAAHARPLPWREPGTTPWGILVSEVMLQQTPVRRVEPMWRAWQSTWPRPRDLAAAPTADVIRAWGGLGYPRRALRLHAAAVAVVERHEGTVPDSYEELRGLPGVGDYTAAAVLAFAYGQRVAVIDVNVRRVVSRLLRGSDDDRRAPARKDRALALDMLPAEPQHAAAVSAALMELGATVCIARSPRCEACPLKEACLWRRSGFPEPTGPARRRQAYAGTDRQVRGIILRAARTSAALLPVGDVELLWPDSSQRDRALASLVADGLLVIRSTDEKPAVALP